MKRFWMSLSMVLLTVGCRAQLPVASMPAVGVSWTIPAASGSFGGCTVAKPCTFAVARAPVVSGSCPVSTDTSWVEITSPTSRPSGSTWTDTSVSGTVCYAVTTYQSGFHSAASAPSAQLTVPAVPLAPTNVTPAVQSANLSAPELKRKTEQYTFSPALPAPAVTASLK